MKVLPSNTILSLDLNSIALATGMIRNVNSKNNLNFIKQRLFVFILCNINNKCVKSYDKRKTSTQQ